MSRQVIWAPAAQDEFAKILEYIDENWGTGSALEILDKTESVIEQISHFPNLFPPSQKKGVRLAVINKQTSLIYRVGKNQIEILHFWDNRQNPEALSELLE